MINNFCNNIDIGKWIVAFLLGILGGSMRMAARVKAGRTSNFGLLATIVELLSYGASGMLGMFFISTTHDADVNDVAAAAMIGGYAGIAIFKRFEALMLFKRKDDEFDRPD